MATEIQTSPTPFSEEGFDAKALGALHWMELGLWLTPSLEAAKAPSPSIQTAQRPLPRPEPQKESAKPAPEADKDAFRCALHLLIGREVVLIFETPEGDTRAHTDLAKSLFQKSGAGPILEEVHFAWPAHYKLKSLKEAKSAFYAMRWIEVYGPKLRWVVRLGGAQALLAEFEVERQCIQSHSVQSLLEAPPKRHETWEALAPLREAMAGRERSEVG